MTVMGPHQASMQLQCGRTHIILLEWSGVEWWSVCEYGENQRLHQSAHAHHIHLSLSLPTEVSTWWQRDNLR